MNQQSQSLILAVLAIVALVTANTCHSNYENDYAKVSCQKRPAGIYIDVFCKIAEPWSKLPVDKFNQPDVVKTTFNNCSFPEGLSLLNITQSLGLERINHLELQTSKSVLTRESVKGFTLKELSIVHYGFSKLPQDLLYDVNVEHLQLDNTQLRDLPDDFFKNSINLVHLEITNSNLERLRANDFSTLENLNKLHFYHNWIKEIEPGTFDHMVNLTLLDISNNQLKILPSNLLKKLTKLKWLNLIGNNFNELPSDLLFIPDSKLERFRLSSNRGNLTSLPDGFFKNLSELDEVALSNNNFTSIPENVFQKCPLLNKLTIKQNKLVGLPPGLFKNMRNLVDLDISENLLESLPENIFEDTKLLKLNISCNRLTNLSSDVLLGVSTLKELYISHNNLTYIGHKICDRDYIHNVEVINLSHNKLTLAQSESEFSVLQKCLLIKDLNVSHNNINQVFNDWIRNTNFKIIDLDSNKLTSITAKDIHTMTNHETRLILNNNEITTVNLTEIEYYVHKYRKTNSNMDKGAVVYMNNNPLNCDCNLLDFFLFIKGMFANTEEVHKYITIHTDTLKCASPPEFKNKYIKDIPLEEVKCLVKSKAEEDACNETCACWSYPYNRILSVDCSYKNLVNLPLRINNPQNFSIDLDMSGNLLRQTPSLNFSYLMNVTALDLSSNNVSVVIMDVFSKSLRDLKLHNNSISRLDSKVVAHLTQDTILRNLTLHKNKWICDCEASDFIGALKTKLSTSFELHKVMCYGTNKKLATMTESELCPSQVKLIVSLSLSVAVIGLVLGLLAALYYKHQNEIKVWLYSKQWCLWFVTEDELDKDKQYDAFISYTHEDEDFVEKELVANLEDGPKPFKLCLHYRDWLAGEWIPNQIARSVDESRRTIVVLSPNFIKSVWGRMEFRTAHNQALSEGRARVIVILYGDIGNTDNLDPELKAYLSMNTYVKWGDPWFWDKLRYALPHRYETSKRISRNARIIEKHLSQMPFNNHECGKDEIIPMPKISSPSNDSTKLLDSNVEDERTAATC